MHSNSSNRFRILAALLGVVLASCATPPRQPVSVASHVELSRFMGPWYVIASIPTFIEKRAYSAIESYQMQADGTIATTFTFHQGAFDGPVKTMKPRGTVRDKSSNARWGMQFVWPFKGQYLIAYVSEDYVQAIIARDARDYVWILARQPDLADADYQGLLTRVGQLGYDTSKVKRVPQRGP